MREKLKNVNFNLIINVLKSSLIGVVVSILLVLLFAFVLKFVDLNSGTISLVDQIIKVLSVFVAVVILSKVNNENLLLKGVTTGAIYSIITFIVFSLLNGGFNLGLGLLTDIAFSALVGGISAILLNIIGKK